MHHDLLFHLLNKLSVWSGSGLSLRWDHRAVIPTCVQCWVGLRIEETDTCYSMLKPCLTMVGKYT